MNVPPELLIVAGVAIAALALLLLRKRFPVLRALSSPVENSALRRAERAEAELERANVTIAEQDAQILALERERSLASVISLVEKVSYGVDQTLVKLADMNGGMKHATTALEESTKATTTLATAVEFLAGHVVNRAD